MIMHSEPVEKKRHIIIVINGKRKASSFRISYRRPHSVPDKPYRKSTSSPPTKRLIPLHYPPSSAPRRRPDSMCVACTPGRVRVCTAAAVGQRENRFELFNASPGYPAGGGPTLWRRRDDQFSSSATLTLNADGRGARNSAVIDNITNT